jgi:hypothetical protein
MVLYTRTQKKNIIEITKKLDVPLVSKSSVCQSQKNLVKWITKLNLSKSPGYVMMYLCSGCRNGIWGGAYSVAQKHNIPMIVFGESSFETSQYKPILRKKFTPSLGSKIVWAISRPVVTYQRKRFERLLNSEFPLDNSNQNIKKISFFDYCEWDEALILNTLQRECGWISGDDSTWRFDCKIHVLLNAMMMKLYGFTEHDELYSKLIREGKMLRDDALDRLQRMQQSIKENESQLEEAIFSIGLRDDEAYKIKEYCLSEGIVGDQWR